jgi:NAD(P)-dependent dehydrogenase (short-subunit alcohol dehydrogenase family)
VGGYVNGNLLISVIAGTVTTLTLLALAGAGAEVTLAVRNTRAGAGAAADITATTSNAAVHVAALDLADPRSVAAFIAGWSGPLDILINNAGVMAIPNLQLTPEGWELQFATNHLGHFALAVGLHDALVAAGGGARIVSLSSRGHLRSPVVFDDINFRSRPYDPLVAYGQSKTANVLFAVGANRRWSGDGITANSVHPGAVDTTNLSRHIGGSEAATSRIATRLRSSRRRPRRAPATALQPTRSIPRTPIDCGSCRKAHSSERH